MREFDPAALADSWKRPYTSVQWAWVRALGVAPSAVWADEPRRRRGRRPDPGARELRECFENRRRVLT